MPWIQYNVTRESVKHSLPGIHISSCKPSLIAVINLDKSKADKRSSLGIDYFFKGETLVLAATNLVCTASPVSIRR